MAFVERLLIGIDVTKVRCFALARREREQRLPAQNGTKRVFRRDCRAEIVEGIIAVVFVEIFARQQDFHILARFGQQAAAEGIGIAIVNVLTREEIFPVAVTAIIFASHADH